MELKDRQRRFSSNSKKEPSTKRSLREPPNCKLEIAYAKEEDDGVCPGRTSPIQNHGTVTLESLIKEIHNIDRQTEFPNIKEGSKIRHSKGSFSPYRKYREQNLRFWRKRGFWYNDTLSMTRYCSQIVNWMVDELVTGMADEILSAIQLYEPLVEEFKQ